MLFSYQRHALGLTWGRGLVSINNMRKKGGGMDQGMAEGKQRTAQDPNKGSSSFLPLRCVQRPLLCRLLLADPSSAGRLLLLLLLGAISLLGNKLQEPGETVSY